ncbi:putative peptide zinc metalloprotease protein [Poseidonocella pacifica]|uniref:Putative peptide zinc metalloprotease protein n=1 Tax=Poseidonocella pacifica TaxID=871651 RepID=A0A1I0YEM7_9RHOB|nr:biotin/lipoyl-binding protein [Poseidonocella pacifica]SFB11247.1 putative peptide zinc metalloprotease protein [Poseidonocella pacifica]
MAHRTFYDQWHRIAELRVGLRPGISIRRHSYRGECWYVYYEAAHCGFFRARPETHALVLEIGPERTLNDIWRGYADKSPTTAPGQQDFFDLISALYAANLIYVEGGVSETHILERALGKKRKPLPARISELLFFRIPLWDPEPFLKRHTTAIRVIYSWPVLWLVGLLFVWAGAVFLLNADRAFEQSATILQLGNLLPLYVAIFLTHFLHELSHAALTKFYGGHVRTMGIMLLMLTPLPYADLTSVWHFRDKWKRAAVGAAGMYADLVSCALATLLWAYSPPGAINEIALNLMFVTAVYTFVFNVNPLMRFDGYYILSDLVEIPNLHTAAKAQFNALFRTRFLVEQERPNDVVSPRRRAFLIGFFIASNVYRIMVMLGIVLFVADQYFGLGLLVAAALAYNAFIAPVIRVLKPLKSPHFLRKHRGKLLLSSALGALLLIGVFVVPVPDHKRLDGVVEAGERRRIFVPVSGRLAETAVRSGDRVEEGQVLAQFVNSELDLQITGMEARLAGAQARKSRAIAAEAMELAAIEEEIATIGQSLAHLRAERARLTIRSPGMGIWVSDALTGQNGNWIGRGTEIGQVLDDRSYVFQGILRQETADGIGGLEPSDVAVKIEGARAESHSVAALQILPFSRRDLPSLALSPLAGGDTAISTEDPQDAQSVERFFLVTADLGSLAAGPSGLDGRSGWLRMQLSPKPLAQQGLLAVRQFFQRRYKL